MLIVNYYPGSLGDTIISKLSKLPYRKDSLDRTLIGYPRHLKQTRFYNLPDYLKLAMYNKCVDPWLQSNKIIGAHRFLAYDFKGLDNKINTLSIDPRKALNYVAEMYVQKVYASLGHGNLVMNTVFQKIIDRYGNDTKLINRALVKQISDWADENIQTSDLTICLAKFLIEPECINDYKDLV